MKKVLIVGAGKGGTALLKLLRETGKLTVAAITDVNPHAIGLDKAKSLGIPTGEDWRAFLHKGIDIVIEATGKEKVFEQIRSARPAHTVVIQVLLLILLPNC